MANLTLQLSSATLTGTLGGELLHCSLQVSGAGSLAPGQYTIDAPVQDPVYGLVALLTPSGGTVMAPKKGTGGGLTGSVLPVKKGFGATESPVKKSMGSAGAAMFLTSSAIPGTNSIVLNRGFADLMDALRVSGGAQITVI